MAVLPRLERLLEESHVPYEVHVYPEAFTASAVAHADHVPATEMAKVVVLVSRDGMLMATLPASQEVDLACLGRELGDPEVRLATEPEFAEHFESCELGAMPPFGSLFGMPLWVDDSLGRETETIFNAGTHHETIHMAYRDFARLARPTFGSFGRRPISG